MNSVDGFPRFTGFGFSGNGVSELITMALQALLDNGDQVLICPDYPLWTASTSLAGGTPVHYLCDGPTDGNLTLPTSSRRSPAHQGLGGDQPNNPTGAVCGRDVLQRCWILARKHQLLLLADEIYDKILYDDAEHISLATLAPDLLCLTFNGLSKAYPGGWLPLGLAGDHRTYRPRHQFHRGDQPAGLCVWLCPNVPGHSMRFR